MKFAVKILTLFFLCFFSKVHAQSVSPNQIVCFGDTKAYTVDQADGFSGTPGSTYAWNVLETGFAGSITNQGSNAISINWGTTPVGVYRLSVIETNAYCEGPLIILNITIKKAPMVTVNDAVICSNSSASIKAIVDPADSGNDYTYSWSTPSGVDPGNVAQVVASASGEYSVIVKDVFGCKSVFAKGTVTVNPLPLAVITPVGHITFCEGSNVLLEANTGAGLSYQWKKAGVDIVGATNSSYQASQSSDYTVKVTNNGGCFAISLPVSASVTVNPIPPTEITIPSGESLEFCAGGSVVLNANAGPAFLYEWKNGHNEVVGSSASYTATQSSDYKVTISDRSGCYRVSLPVSVIEHPLPDASITPAGTVLFCDGDNVLLSAVDLPGLSYQWNDRNGAIAGAINSSYAVTQSSDYSVTVTDGNFMTNCTATTSSPITVTKTSLPVTGTIAHD